MGALTWQKLWDVLNSLAQDRVLPALAEEHPARARSTPSGVVTNDPCSRHPPAGCKTASRHDLSMHVCNDELVHGNLGLHK